MFISIANATTEVGTAVSTSPAMADTFWTNMGLVGLMFVLFYVLMIRPQQKRMREQRDMLDTLKVGDKIVTGGGLLGSVSKIISDSEVEIDLGGVKVNALRYTIQTNLTLDAAVKTPSNDKAVASKAKDVTPKATTDKSSKKTVAAVKAPAAKADVKKAPEKKTVVKKSAAKTPKASAKKANVAKTTTKKKA